MMETMAIEAVNAVNGINSVQAAQQIQQAVDPSAVEAFNEAMQPTEIPFASQVAGTWATAQVNYQEMLHRVHALTSASKSQALSAAELSELQYEVANLSFQQEIVTNIAKKASDAVSTLVKNG